MTATAIWIARIVIVVALLCVAAFLASPPDRLPLALRGLRRLMRRDRGLPEYRNEEGGVPTWKRILAFLIVLLAAGVALA